MSVIAGPPDRVLRDLAAAIGDLPATRDRKLVALAGPPGSGKSTLAAQLKSALDARGQPTGLLAMDGFHLDNRILASRGLQNRKGAPETFDLAGFTSMLALLRSEDEIAVPVFDRQRDSAIAACEIIARDQRIVLVEGNYLLLRDPGWAGCADHWDLSIFLDVPEAILQTRLLNRWRDHGVDADTARARVGTNDLPNARRVVTGSRPADIVVRHPD